MIKWVVGWEVCGSCRVSDVGYGGIITKVCEEGDVGGGFREVGCGGVLPKVV